MTLKIKWDDVKRKPAAPGRRNSSPAKTRIFLSTAKGCNSAVAGKQPAWGASPELDKEWKDYNRKLLAAWRPLVKQLVDLLHPDHGKISFSRKAGCSCGCSPGWIVDGWFGENVWVELELEDK